MTTFTEMVTSPETVGVWTLVPDRSTVSFKCASMWGLIPIKGTFGDVTGDGQVAEGGAVFGRVDIRAASLRTGIGKRDEHLRSADFFDVERFGDISVVVTAAESSDAERATLRASLTIKDTTRPIELPVTVHRLDDGAVRLATKATVDRTDFGVTGNLVGMVRYTVRVTGDLVFVQAK